MLIGVHAITISPFGTVFHEQSFPQNEGDKRLATHKVVVLAANRLGVAAIFANTKDIDGLCLSECIKNPQTFYVAPEIIICNAEIFHVPRT